VKRVIFAIVAVTLLVAPRAQARTWHINAAGTGDAPTIAAGLDSATAGDTVLVAAGTYGVHETYVKPGLVLTSEDGPAVTRLVDDSQFGAGAALWTGDDPPGSSSSEVSGFWFDGYPLYALLLYSNSNIAVKYCIFTNNFCGVYSNLVTGHVYIEHCTFIDSPQTDAGLVVDSYPSTTELWYSIMWDHQYGELSDGYANDYKYIGEGGSFSLDPQFCGVDDYFLQSDSPVAPGTEPFHDSFFLGALPVGCGSVKVEAKSWGEVKALYR
jgi:hypothetical protein